MPPEETTATQTETTDNAVITPDPKTEAKFTQADMDKIAGNRAKEAAAAAVKKLLKDLGVNPDDEKATDTIKSRLTAAQQAEDAQKTSEQKLQEKITALEKERDTATAARTAIEQERRLEKRDNKIIAALNVKTAGDLLILMNTKKPDLVKAVMKEDGTIDDVALAKLVTETKTDYKSAFVGTGAGSPSNSGGTNTKPPVVLTQQGKF